MVDKTTQLAQTVAEGLSRRGFFARFGRGAAIAALALAGILLLPGEAQAGRRCSNSGQCPNGQMCIWGRCFKFSIWGFRHEVQTNEKN
jgi:hypothetical protein